MLQEFKEFAVKGNVLDLTVGFISGASFTSVVRSFIEDVAMPSFRAVIKLAGADDQAAGAAVDSAGASSPLLSAASQSKPLDLGAFAGSVLNFVLVAFFVFLMVKAINRMKRGQEPAPESKECPFCCLSVPIKATRCGPCTTMLDTGVAVT